MTGLFDAIAQPKPKILLHAALISASKSMPSLAFNKFLKHIFCEKVAGTAINELPSLIETLLS